MIAKMKSVLTGLAVFIAMFGVIGFSLFILEEGFQCAQFGTWQAIASGNWELTLQGADIMSSINTISRIVNYSIGWINPLSFFSYRSYQVASDYYIRTLKSRVFANAPEVFIGRNVRFSFTPRTIQQHAGHIELINDRIHILTTEMPTGKTVSVQGRLEQQGKLLIVDMRE
jgi:hypothetical protein